MALSGDEDDLFDATHSEPDNHVDIKKNLLSDLSEESPIKASEEFMAPPPVPDPAESPEKMCVFLRIRPLTNVEEMEEKRECVVVRDPTRVDMIAPKESKTYEHSAHGCGKVVSSFNFTRVYDEFTSQQKLFNDCMLSTIKDFVDGQNCLVFAYGVTNSGKTYTMLGPPKDQGIIPRSLDVIFNSIGDKQFEGADLKPQLYCEVKKLELKEMADADKFKTMIINAASRTTFDSTSLYASSDSLASQSSIGGESSVFEGADEDLVRTSISTECQGNIKFSIWVSFAEIYNEQIHDLLEPLAKSETLAKKRKILILREDKHGNPYIKDLRHIHVTSADEALKVLTFGQKNLQYACTKLNESSSRSHCIFTVKIVRVVDKLNPRKARMSQLSFCDLAGSERYTRTGNTGDRLKEAANINTSLLTLGRCIQLLRQNQIGRISKDRVVPFRDSKLTRLFQTYFSGKGKACMVVNVSPAVSSFDENIQALKFSSIARQVQFIADKVQHLPKPGKPRTELSLALEQGDDSRMTIAWAPPEELSEPSKLPQLTEEDESAGPRYAEYDSAIEKLKKALIETNELLKQERRMKKQMEANLRQEICQEMMEQITEIENHYEQELEEERMRCEEVVETKVNMVTSAIHKSVKRKRLEEEEIMQADKVKLDENESQIEDLQETITKLEEKLADATQTISQLGKQEPMAIEEPGDRESINALNDQICTLSESNIQLYAHGNELKGEILTLKAVSEEKDRKVEQLDTKIRMLTEQQAKMEKPDDDLTNNEIFINITTQLDEAKSVIEDKEKELADLRQTLEEAGETFQQKDSQITSLRTQLTGCQTELSAVEASKSLININLDSTSAKLSKAEESCNRMNRENDQLLTKVSQLEQHNENVEAQLKSVQLESVQLKTDTSEEFQLNLAEQQKQINIYKLEALIKAEQILQLKRDMTESDGRHCAWQSETDRKHELNVRELEMEVLAVSRGLQTSDKEKEEAQKKCEQLQKRVELMEFELQENTAQLETCQSESEQLKLQVVQRTEEYDNLVTEMGQLKETLGRLDNSDNTKEMETKCNSLTANMKKLQDQIRRRSVEWQGDLGTVQTQLLTTKKELGRVKKEKDRLSKENSDYQQDIQEVRKKNAANADELEDVTEKLAQFTQKYQEAECSIDSFTTKQRQLELELADSQCAKSELETEQHNLRELLQKSESQSSMSESTVYRLRKEINGHSEQMATLKSESDENSIKDMKQQLEKNEASLEVKRKENQELKDEVATLQTVVKETEARCDKFAIVATRVKDFNEKLDQQKLLHETATHRIQQLAKENSLLKERLASSTSTEISITKLEQEVKALKEDVSSKEKKAASLQVILDARQSEWDRKDNSFESLKLKAQQTEKDLQDSNAQLQAELTALSSQLSALQDENSALSSKFLSKEKQLHDKINSLTEELSAAQERLKNVTKRNSVSNHLDHVEECKDKVIENLKEALSVQESTMKLQDELVESREEEIYKLTKEICDWRLKYQELCDIELEKNSLASKLNSLTNEKDFLQKTHAQMMSQVGSVNQKTSKLEAEVQRLATSNDELQKQCLEKDSSNSLTITADLEEKEKQLLSLKDEMGKWQEDKNMLVGELEKVLNEKTETIKRLLASNCPTSMGEDLTKKINKYEEKILRKDSIILQLEHKIRSQESTIQDLVVGSGTGRVTRNRCGSATSLNNDDVDKMQSLEADLKVERCEHNKTRLALDRVLTAKDEQLADLKEANAKLQNEIERLDVALKLKTPSRPSDRFKDPTFCNDDELSASTLELDATPMSSSKKGLGPIRKSSRLKNKSVSSQKELTTSASKSTLKRLKDLVQKSTSPAKRLLSVRITPLKGADRLNKLNLEESFSSPSFPASPEAVKPKKRRKLYTLDETTLTSAETPKEDASRRTSRRAAANVHSIVTRNVKNMHPK